ncbi:MAG: hypothetical protein ON057_000472 [Glomeribacter sp. 1016415]|nr:hypothetical protein [Glomeribacter sp. 1016415]
MNNTINVAVPASMNTITLSSLMNPLEQGKFALMLAETQRERYPTTALESFNIAKIKLSDALAQNEVLSCDEKHNIQVSLARACLLRGDILRDLRRVEEARVDYTEARQHGSQDAEQRLSSLSSSPQASLEERGKIKTQVVGGLISTATDGTGNIYKVDYKPTNNDRQFLEQIKDQHTRSLNTLQPTLSRPPAAKGEESLQQFSFGVIAGATSGQNNTFTVRYGSSSASETGSDQANLDIEKKQFGCIIA